MLAEDTPAGHNAGCGQISAGVLWHDWRSPRSPRYFASLRQSTPSDLPCASPRVSAGMNALTKA